MVERRARAAKRSEVRREKRTEERHAQTRCFACRQMGHSAKDCAENQSAQTLCYRCGSTEHSLSQCKKPDKGHDDLPFARCFICQGQGHLSSKCKQNKGKGIYPQGGHCKVCKSVEHLARNCPLNAKQDNSDIVRGLEDDEEDEGRMRKRRAVDGSGPAQGKAPKVVSF